MVIIYLGLLCIGQLTTFFYKLFTGSGIAWYALISGVAYCSLAAGLSFKRNAFRILTMLWAVVEILNRAFVLGLAVFSKEVWFDPFEIQIFMFHIPLSDSGWAILWSLFLFLNAAIIAVFMRTDIKSIYSKKNHA